MPIIYKKTLCCGCTIISIVSYMKKDIIFIGSHKYNYICQECVNLSYEILDERLEDIQHNDNVTSENNNNGWKKIA